MDESVKDELLIALLDCGYGDLGVLGDCLYDMGQIVEECKVQFGKIGLNELAMVMFDFGRADIQNYCDDLIDTLDEELTSWKEAVGRGQELTEEEKERVDLLESDLEILKNFDVYEDLPSRHNFLDTNIWLSGDNKERIRQLLGDAFDEFERNTGYCIED